MKQNVAHLGQTVAARRRELGLSQIEVWRAGGPSNSTLTGIENASVDTVSPSTLRKLDRALRWTEGSAASVLHGGFPTVSIVLRNKAGEPTYAMQSIEGGEQPELERLRLATLVADSRDFLRSEHSPRLTMLAHQLDEAFELAVRAVARATDEEDVTQPALAHAEKRIDDARATNTIRRQGPIYVVVDDNVTNLISSHQGPSLDIEQARDVEALNPDDEVTEEEFATAARNVPGKPREQVEFEHHSAAGEESQDVDHDGEI